MVSILETKICGIMTTYQIVGVVFVIVGIWIAYEFYRAPMMDEGGRITKPGKKLSDLWRKQK